MSGCCLLLTAKQSKRSPLLPCFPWKPMGLRRLLTPDLYEGLNSIRENVEVRLGEHDIWEPEGTEQHILSAKFVSHPDYNPRTQDSDIMLIRLSRPAKLDGFVRPAALPSKCAGDGTMCQVSGWGNLRPSDEGCGSRPEPFSRHYCPLQH